MVCPLLWWCCVQGAFAPRSSEVAFGFLVFLYLVHNFPQLHMYTIIFSSFVFCCWRRRLSRCKHYSKGSQVPGPSLYQVWYLCSFLVFIIILWLHTMLMLDKAGQRKTLCTIFPNIKEKISEIPSLLKIPPQLTSLTS